MVGYAFERGFVQGVGYTWSAGGWMIAAVFTEGLRPQGVGRGRKVRTPQGSVPDNVRDGGFKTSGRQVQQRTNRPRLVIYFGKSASGLR
jgi:hypothetical protein